MQKQPKNAVFLMWFFRNVKIGDEQRVSPVGNARHPLATDLSLYHEGRLNTLGGRSHERERPWAGQDILLER